MIIVAVSYDAESLNSHLRGLERAGNVVLPASSFLSCMNTLYFPFHLLVLEASVPQADREKLAHESRAMRPNAKIISVEQPGSLRLELADVVVPAGNEHILLEAVQRFQSGR